MHKLSGMTHSELTSDTMDLTLIGRRISLWQGLCLYRTKTTQKECRVTSKPRMELEQTISVYERSQTEHASDL
jgi:hypothetical protein